MDNEATPAITKDLAPSGRLRAAINFGNPVLAQKDAATGEPRGVSAELARELGRRLGISVEFVPFDGAGKVVDAVKAEEATVAAVALHRPHSGGDETADGHDGTGGLCIPEPPLHGYFPGS